MTRSRAIAASRPAARSASMPIASADVERAYRESPQRGEMCRGAERPSEIARDRSDVCSASAHDEQARVGRIPFRHLESMDLHLPRR